MITLVQLEYIVAVDTYRHFVTASEKCFVTQPTISMQIKKLESDLGIVIFDRSKTPIIPTEIGKKIIEQARYTISQSKKINELIDEYNNNVSGEITIAIIPSLSPYLLPLFIGNFRKKHPDIKIKIIELLTEEIIQHLQTDQIDVGILVTPLNEKGIIEEPLFYEEMLLYVNKKHPLAKNKNVEPNELASPDLWLLSNGHCFRSQVINLCNYKTTSLENSNFEYTSDSLETVKKMVEIENGFTILPELAIPQYRSKATIKRFTKSKPLREISLVYTRNYVKKKTLKLLSQEIKTSIPSEMLDKDRGVIAEWREINIR